MASNTEVVVLDKITSTWEKVVKAADSYIVREELSALNEKKVEEFTENNLFPVSLFSLNRLVYNVDEGIVDKLVNVYSSMNSFEATVFTIINGNKNGQVEIYIGCRCVKNPSAAGTMLKSSMEGNFPGVSMTQKDGNEKEVLLDKLFPLNYENMSLVSLSVSADFRKVKNEDTTAYIQGIEKFINTMKGQSYTALFLAEPVSKSDCRDKRESLEEIISELTKYSKITVSYNESNSETVSSTLSHNTAKTVTNSINKTISTNTAKSISRNKGRNSGSSSMFFGANHSHGSSHGTARTTTSGKSTSNSTGESISENEGNSESESKSTATTSGTTYTQNIENKRITDIISKFEYELSKMDTSESFGLWDTAIYVLSDNRNTAVIGANSIRSLVIGDESGKANSFINIWDSSKKTFDNCLGRILSFLHYGFHPVFSKDISVDSETSTYYFTPAVSVGGNVLPSLMGLPMKSVPGITVLEMAEFGRNIVTDDTVPPGKRKIRIGNVSYMGIDDNTQVELYVNSLSEHTFVCGAPGSGKSNSVYQLLNGLLMLKNSNVYDDGIRDVSFLVIEPAKGEYKFEFGAMPKVNIFTTKTDLCQMLRINPFEFPYEKMDVKEHIEGLKDIITACWPLTAAMPAILSDAIEKAYLYAGWDLTNSIYVFPGNVKFPCFSDVLEILPKIIRSSSYSADAKGDYTGALVTRVASLTKGIAGSIFCDSGTIPDEVLFDENTIVDLSTVGSVETRSLIMGVLVKKLENYRKATATRMNYPLRHVTVLEEAHNLLPRCSTEQSADSSNVQGKSVETISAAISEMRTYGEGFIIIDQSPSAVADVAVSNTSTKIIMRLPAEKDVEAAGSSIGLTENQIKFIPMLPKGQAIIKQGNWINPVVTMVDKAPMSYRTNSLEKFEYNDLKGFKGDLFKKCIAVINRNLKGSVKNTDVNSVVKYISKHYDIADHYKLFITDRWVQFCSLDEGTRNYMLPSFIMDLVSFHDGLLICSPKLKYIPDKNKSSADDMYGVLENWMDRMETMLKFYIEIDDEADLENLIYQIMRYCLNSPPSIEYKICASEMIKLRNGE